MYIYTQIHLAMCAARSQLTDELHEVFQLYDEDSTGTISLKELGRAMYTVTGEHLQRAQLVQLVTAARAKMQRRRLEQQQQGRPASTSVDSPNASSSSPQNFVAGSEAGGSRPNTQGGGSSQGRRTIASSGRLTTAAAAADAIDGIDLELFEETVLLKLNDRSEEEEQRYAFGLLEDKYYAGFITKESLSRAAMEVDEPLTEAELTEMFHHLVTGVPTAAVDYTTFAAMQEAAQRQDGE